MNREGGGEGKSKAYVGASCWCKGCGKLRSEACKAHCELCAEPKASEYSYFCAKHREENNELISRMG